MNKIFLGGMGTEKTMILVLGNRGKDISADFFQCSTKTFLLCSRA